MREDFLLRIFFLRRKDKETNFGVKEVTTYNKIFAQGCTGAQFYS